jgi:dihydrofolate reductase
MAKLLYSMNTSLDGFVADPGDTTAPDAEVCQFINDLERDVGTSLFGRRMYETMVYWETFEGSDDEPWEDDFAEIWRAANKVVYSTTLQNVSSAKTRLESTFDVDAVRRMKESERRDISISGPNLAGQALAAGLVDELHMYVAPVIVGGGRAAYPSHVRTELELLGLDRFASGVTHLHYRIVS